MLEHWELITPIVTRLVGGWGLLAQRTSPTCQAGLDPACWVGGWVRHDGLAHLTHPPGGLGSRLVGGWDCPLGTLGQRTKPTHQAGNTPPWGVARVHGGQRPIFLEYQIYLPAGIDTPVTGMSLTRSQLRSQDSPHSWWRVLFGVLTIPHCLEPLPLRSGSWCQHYGCLDTLLVRLPCFPSQLYIHPFYIDHCLSFSHGNHWRNVRDRCHHRTFWHQYRIQLESDHTISYGNMMSFSWHWGVIKNKIFFFEPWRLHTQRLYVWGVQNTHC